MVPILEYDAEKLTLLTLHPVTLGMPLPRHERGTPLARTYATAVCWDGDTGTGSVPIA